VTPFLYGLRKRRGEHHLEKASRWKDTNVVNDGKKVSELGVDRVLLEKCQGKKQHEKRKRSEGPAST